MACISAYSVLYYEIVPTHKCGVNADRFETFLSNMLLWVPESATIILDNCKIHHCSQITGLLHLLDRKYLFLAHIPQK